jgi:N-methylhydantoinase B
MLVAADVKKGVFSAAVAESIFGVVLRDGELDVAATAARRQSISKRRLGWTADRSLPIPHAFDKTSGVKAVVGDVARLQRDERGAFFVCEACDTAVAPADENWKDYARHHVASPEELGPRVRVHEDLEVVQHACPHCAQMLDVEVRRKGEASLLDVQVAV